MTLNSIEQLYAHLRNFRITGSEEGIDFGSINAFWEITYQDIMKIEQQLGFDIPSQLREFYLNVGHGRLKVDATGIPQRIHLNAIVEPTKLLSLWDRTDVSYQVDERIADDNEMPFFDTGDHYYLVMRPKEMDGGKIYHPFDQKPVAANFNEFIMKLCEDSTFYLDDPGVNRDAIIENCQDFYKALSILLNDPEFPEKNIHTVAFIEAMQTWLETFEEGKNLFKEPSNRYITWSDLYKLLQVAAIYER